MIRRHLAALLIVLACAHAASARKAPRPYDFTGRWVGPIRVEGERFDVTADLSMSGPTTFTGSVTVGGPNGTVTCSATGERVRKTTAAFACEDGTAVALSGRLNTRRGRLKGRARLSKGSAAALKGRFKLVQQAAPAVCGDGHVDAGEACDDGNAAAGDGCAPDCTLEVTDVSEIEPNDDFPQATPVPTLPALAHGAVATSLDLDFFRIEITGSDLILETFEGDGQGSCPSADTFLELRGSDGVSIVRTDDDDGIGKCSRLELHGLAPGVYYPCVRGFLTAVPAYSLLISAP